MRFQNQRTASLPRIKAAFRAGIIADFVRSPFVCTIIYFSIICTHLVLKLSICDHGTLPNGSSLLLHFPFQSKTISVLFSTYFYFLVNIQKHLLNVNILETGIISFALPRKKKELGILKTYSSLVLKLWAKGFCLQDSALKKWKKMKSKSGFPL